MGRVVALIDGEHYPPVVRFALDELRKSDEVVGAAFAGGTEKIGSSQPDDVYGVPVVTGSTAEEALKLALARFSPERVADLSDEPVVSSADRFRLASLALEAGAVYEGADFRFEPPVEALTTATPALAIIGTGKRVGKTSLSAHVARHLKAGGHDIVVLAMGRGGPAEPELIHGDQIELTTSDLLALARQGVHAASDNYEDAVMSRVTTVGCRRCGGGMGGSTFFSNVPEGARMADGLGKELLVLEGSGAAIPPVASDADLLVVGAAQGVAYVTDYFGPYRLARADAVVIAGAEEPVADAARVAEVERAVQAARPGLPCVPIVFRPRPLSSVEGKRVFFATTAPPDLVPRLAEHLEKDHGCTVVAASPNLSDRPKLREDMERAAGGFDLLVTELKAAAIDVVAEAGEAAGVPTVLCDNVPHAVGGADMDGLIDGVAALALQRGHAREKSDV